MTEELFAAIDGQPLSKVTLTVGNVGPWFADCVCVEAPALSGKVTLQIGTLQLSGTVDPKNNGVFGEQRKLRIVAGGGGWATLLGPKSYANDAGQKALNVAQDAAREAGEVLGTFAPAAARVGSYYVRQAGPASRVLEDVIGGVPWYVDYDGVTHVGARAASTPASTTYEVLEHSPGQNLVLLAVDDPGAVRIGSVLTERLDAPLTVRDLVVTVTGRDVRVSAWTGGTASSAGRLPGLLKAIARRATDDRLYGVYRYRVTTLADTEGARLNLQAVRKTPGLPDVLPVAMWGAAGIHPTLSLGTEVLVQFIDGERAEPFVIACAGVNGPSFVPQKIRLCEGSAPVARVGDRVTVYYPPVVPFTGLYQGNPIEGVLTITNPGIGIIEGPGNERVLA